MDKSNADFYINGKVCADIYYKYVDYEEALRGCQSHIYIACTALNDMEWSGNGKDSFLNKSIELTDSMYDLYELLDKVEEALKNLIEYNKNLMKYSKQFSLIKSNNKIDYIAPKMML